VTGLTGNFVNSSTSYQTEFRLAPHWGARNFSRSNCRSVAVGYFYKQLTAAAATPDIGPPRIQVIGVGPQIGYLFPVGNMQGIST